MFDIRIAVIGTGYVGLVTGTCFSEHGNHVWCVDVDEQKINDLKNGVIKIYESGLESLIKENTSQDRLHFTTNITEAIEKCEICFISVGTPMDENGRADLRYVFSVAEDIGRVMKHPICIVNKSTVPVGTARKVRELIQNELDLRGESIDFDVVSVPEFLKEGVAVSDCMRPDRIVIGADSDKPIDLLKELYNPFVRNVESIIVMDVESAEMTKYAANAMLATKISLMNEIASICERVGADVNRVRIGIGSDNRIGYQFIYPGCGYGGSCFPKDMKALMHIAYEAGVPTDILHAVSRVNDKQKLILAQKVKERFGEDLAGRRFAVWGLSFKPDTDDMREAPSVAVINELTRAGAIIYAYDPKAMEAARKSELLGNPNVIYTRSKYDAVENADAMILVTEWKEFRSPDFDELKEHMKAPIIFDGRNQYDKKQMQKRGFEYYQIGVCMESAAT